MTGRSRCPPASRRCIGSRRCRTGSMGERTERFLYFRQHPAGTMATAIWRLPHERHADSAFGGEGARRHGGRFNSPETLIFEVPEGDLPDGWNRHPPPLRPSGLETDGSPSSAPARFASPRSSCRTATTICSIPPIRRSRRLRSVVRSLFPSTSGRFPTRRPILLFQIPPPPQPPAPTARAPFDSSRDRSEPR